MGVGLSINGNPQSNATTVGPDAVDSVAIIDGEVMMVDLADLSVSTAKLQDGAVTDVKITGPISAANLDLSSRVAVAGDTMSGLLILSGAPTLDLHASTKKYVDDSIGGIDLTPFVLKAGSTMTGLLTLSGAPTADLHSSTKKYVDDSVPDISVKVDKAGDTMTGLLTLSGVPTADFHASTKKYVDDSAVTSLAASAITNVAAGNIVATDVQAAVNELDSEKVAKAGDTMTGDLTFNGGSDIILTSGGKITTVNSGLEGISGAPGNVMINAGTGSGSDFFLRYDGGLRWFRNGTVELDNSVANELVVTSGKISQAAAPTAGNDLTNKTYIDGAVGGKVFGNGYDYNSNAVLATTSLSTPIEKARIDMTGLDAGDYLVVAEMHFSTSNANGRAELDVIQDPDGAATSIDSVVTAGPAVGTAAVVHMAVEVAVGAGSESFSVQFFHSSGSGSTTLETSNIYAYRVA